MANNNPNEALSLLDSLRSVLVAPGQDQVPISSSTTTNAAGQPGGTSSQQQADTSNVQAPRRKAGRPPKYIPKEELENLLKLNIPISAIAVQFGVSRHVVYNAIRQHGIDYERFTNYSAQEIERTVYSITQAHPNSGEVMVQGHLETRGVHVQRHKIRRAIHSVDPEGVQKRKQAPIKRRVYSVPCPNYLWHIDGNHKLVRWRLVVHHAIDGFSRLVVFACCSPNNRASTVHSLYCEALPKYGRPLHVRTDRGGENVEIWQDMITARGEETTPVLVGKSVHNQRIERHNRALNEQVIAMYKNELYELESEGILDIHNDTDIFCLHYVYLSRINKTIAEFVAAHNNHKVSTEGNNTPAQMFWCNLQRTLAMHEDTIPHVAHTVNVNDLVMSNLPHVVVPDTPNPLDEGTFAELQRLVDPLSQVIGSELYREVVGFVGRHMLRQ